MSYFLALSKYFFDPIAILLLLLLHFDESTASSQNIPDVSTYIQCQGAVLDCTTVAGVNTCEIHWPWRPRVRAVDGGDSKTRGDPIVCLLKHACISTGTGKGKGPVISVRLDNPSPLHVAYNNTVISTESLSLDTGAFDKNFDIRDPATLRVYDSKQNIPPNPLSFNSGVRILVHHNGNSNIGHVWGDILWPVFQMMTIWNKQDSSNLTFIINGHKIPQHNHLFSGHNHKNNVYHLQELQSSICFDEVLVGNNGMSYSEGLSNARLLVEYRNFIYEHYGFPISHSFPSTRVLPNVLIFHKKLELSGNKCAFGNLPEILNMFKIHFPTLNVTVISLFDHPSIRKQIELMINTDIVLSLPGSDVMNSLFLPDRSTLIVPCRKIQLIEPSNEIRIWFRKFAQIRAIEICGEEDVVFKDNNLAILNITNLHKIFSYALDDWQSRRP